MSKTRNKIFIIAFAIVLIFSNVCFAATTSSQKAKFEIVENNICTINIMDTATFEKKIVSYDLEKKELDIQLKVTNTAVPIINKPTDIMFVIDNSLSMRDNMESSTATRMEAVINSAKSLANNLLDSEYVKIGVVSFSTGDVMNEGQITDAVLRTTPTNVKDTVMNAIDAVSSSGMGARTNIDAGLTLANQNYTATSQSKYIILLSDGVPNTALGGITYTYSGPTAEKTIQTLTNLTNSGVKLFTVMSNIEATKTEPQTNLTYKQLAEEIFGTESNPAFGKFYYVSDSALERTISETVLSNFQDPGVTTLTNLKIYDYFPQEIVDNFDFSYVSSPTKGTISEDIDLQNNMITWTIDKLGPQESATVVYKLKLKDTINTDILDVILKTNEKVDITANEITNPDGTPKTLTSDVTPKVRVTIPAEPATVTVKYLEKGSNKELLPSEVINGNIDDPYKTERKEITGYEAAEPEPTNKEGKITEEPITVIYYYSKNTSTVTVKYLEKGTNKELLPSDIINGNVDDPYITQRKTIDGYDAAKPEPKNTSGKITEEPITVIYYYSKTPDKTVAPTIIPQTGATMTLSIIFICVVAVGTYSGIKMYILNK